MISIQLTVSALAVLALLGQSEAMPTGPGPEDIPSPAEIAAAFSAADTDGDGKITRDQIKQFMLSMDKDSFMTSALASNSDVSEDLMIDLAMAMADTDGDGMVSLDEINAVVAMASDKEGASEAALNALVKVFDKDGSGALNVGELTEVDKQMMGGQMGGMVGFMVGMMDKDGDGELNAKELKAMMG